MKIKKYLSTVKEVFSKTGTGGKISIALVSMNVSVSLFLLMTDFSFTSILLWCVTVNLFQCVIVLETYSITVNEVIDMMEESQKLGNYSTTMKNVMDILKESKEEGDNER